MLRGHLKTALSHLHSRNEVIIDDKYKYLPHNPRLTYNVARHNLSIWFSIYTPMAVSALQHLVSQCHSHSNLLVSVTASHVSIYIAN